MMLMMLMMKLKYISKIETKISMGSSGGREEHRVLLRYFSDYININVAVREVVVVFYVRNLINT